MLVVVYTAGGDGVEGDAGGVVSEDTRAGEHDFLDTGITG